MGSADQADEHGQTGCDSGRSGRLRLPNRAHRFDQNQICSACRESGAVFAVLAFECGQRRNEVRSVTILERGRRPRDPDSGVALRGAASERDREFRELVSPVAEACPPKDTGLGAKCIGREAVDSGCHVVAVNRFDGLGRVEQRLGRPQGQAAVESTPFQFRAGCPVEKEQSPLQVVG